MYNNQRQKLIDLASHSDLFLKIVHSDWDENVTNRKSIENDTYYIMNTPGQVHTKSYKKDKCYEQYNCFKL